MCPVRKRIKINLQIDERDFKRTVSSNAGQEEFDPSNRFNLFFVSLTLEFQIFRVAVEDVDLRRWDVDVVEQVFMHKIPIGLIMFSG